MTAPAPPSAPVVPRLVEHIRREGLAPGDRLPSIRELARRWAIGPNFVRDGLLQAQTMGLVKVHPRSGAFVRSVDFSSLVDGLAGTLETALAQDRTNLIHLVEARVLLESAAADAAAARRRPEDLFPLREALDAMRARVRDRAAFVAADEDFHLAVARLTGNPALVVILRALLVLLRPYRLYLTPAAGSLRRTLDQHGRICRCLVEGDRRGACAAMREHLADHRRNVVRQAGLAPGGARERQRGRTYWSRRRA